MKPPGGKGIRKMARDCRGTLPTLGREKVPGGLQL